MIVYVAFVVSILRIADLLEIFTFSPFPVSIYDKVSFLSLQFVKNCGSYKVIYLSLGYSD